MATVTITLTDDGKGAVDVAVDFGSDGYDQASGAHEIAKAMIDNSIILDDKECGHG